MALNKLQLKKFAPDSYRDVFVQFSFTKEINNGWFSK